MVEDMRKILLGNALSAASRRQITAWLTANRTGDERIRVGVPQDWEVGDKTGTSRNGAASDVAIVWPPDRQPILLAIYMAETQTLAGKRDAAFAEVTRIVVEAV